jgi:trimeric autotransporter adhesin
MKKLITIIGILGCLHSLYAQQLSKVGGGIPGLYINDIALFDGKLYAGGYFTPNGVAKDHVYSFNGSQWQTMKGGISGPTFPFISAFAVFNNKLYMCGAIDKTGTFNTQDLAVWDGVDWSDPSGGINNAKAMFVFNNELYVGTTVIVTDPISKALFWKWNGSSWQNLADSFGLSANPNFDIQGIHTTAVYKGRLIVAGLFETINGDTVNNIALWDGGKWAKLGTGVNGYVKALEVWNDELYVGGNFDLAGGKPTNFLTKWNGTEWTSINGGLDQRVEALKVYNGNLWVGGQFFNPARGILKYDGQNFTVPFVPDGGVTSFLVDGNSLLLSGDFQKINGTQYSLIARYTDKSAGVSTLVKGGIGLYPNPANNVLNLTIANSGVAQITVFDNIGRRVLEKQTDFTGVIEIPIANLPAGNYYITVLQGDEYTSSSFIKQ